MHDTLVHDGHRFLLAGIAGQPPFSPDDHGLSPVALSTACRRGFVCQYRVADGSLLLDRLDIGLRLRPAEADAAPHLSGHAPRWEALLHCFVYEALNLELP